MKSRLFTALGAFLVCTSFASLTSASLIDRGNGLIYDDVLQITWLADANLAATRSFDVSGISSGGSMSWRTAQEWISAMNNADYLNHSEWRMPHVTPINGASFNYSYQLDGTTDVGYNVSEPTTVYAGSIGSEMAHLFYNTLGNTGRYYPTGVESGCLIPPTGCLMNQGPFTNIQSLVDGHSTHSYWNETLYAPNQDLYAWVFNFARGNQGYNYYADDSLLYSAWAVHDGDIGAVPLPPAVYLFGFGLIGLAGMARRKD